MGRECFMSYGAGRFRLFRHELADSAFFSPVRNPERIFGIRVVPSFDSAPYCPRTRAVVSALRFQALRFMIHGCFRRKSRHKTALKGGLPHESPALAAPLLCWFRARSEIQAGLRPQRIFENWC